MKILFVDPRLAYDAYTSSRLPLGGTQSAVTYLARALAEAGVAISVANLRDDDVAQEGVTWLSLSKLQTHFAHYLSEERITHIVVVGAAVIASLRPKVNWAGYWILWNHLWIDQPALAALVEPAVRSRWDVIVSVSAFHHRGMARKFDLAPERHWVLRNAINPHLEAHHRSWEQFREQRMARTSARWVYTSAPYRGLDVLAAAWRRLGPPPDWSCTAVSGMSLYHSDDARFGPLLDRVAATPGMRLLNPVGQAELARLLDEHDFWAYPCTQTETSCIAALEAVAAGLYPVTTNVGALFETLEGWGTFVSGAGDGLAERWAEDARTAWRQRNSDPEAWLRAVWEQHVRVVSEWTWARRAREWLARLRSLPS